MCAKSTVKNSILLNVGCKKKQGNNSEITYFSLPKEPQRRESWLAAISRDKRRLIWSSASPFPTSLD